MSPRLAFALETAWQAGRLSLAEFQRGRSYERKADATPVTDADRTVERFLRERISARYPDEAILGEEEGEREGSGPGRWVVDPIDGTKSFVAGVPLYAVLLAYEEGEVRRLGVCVFPALGEAVWAERGEGCYWNGRPARVSQCDRLEDAILCSAARRGFRRVGRAEAYDALEERVAIARTWCDAYGHVLVATGRADLMLDPVVAPWDVAALEVIVEEAGGRMTDFEGRPGPSRNAISSNGRLHDRVLEAFR